MSASLNFDSAYAELLSIQHKIQDDSLNVEELASLVKRSAELIQFCKKRLRSIEDDVNHAFEGE